MSAEKKPRHQDSDHSAEVVPVNQSSNGNGGDPSHNGTGDLPPMWEGPVDFVLVSAEGTLVLKPEEQVDIPAVVDEDQPEHVP
jgi:hypothetical protein